MTERTQQVLSYDVDASQVLGEYDDLDDFAEYDATLTSLQEIFGGRVFTCAPYPPGTVADLEAGCPMFQDAISKGFEYARDWLEMLDGRVQEEQPEEDIDPLSLTPPESLLESSSTEQVVVQKDTVDNNADEAQQTSMQISDKEAHLGVDERLGVARQDVAAVFSEIETEVATESASIKDTDTSEVSTVSMEPARDDLSITERSVEVEVVAGDIQSTTQDSQVEVVDSEDSTELASVAYTPDEIIPPAETRQEYVEVSGVREVSQAELDVDEIAPGPVSYTPLVVVEATNDSQLASEKSSPGTLNVRILSDDASMERDSAGAAADAAVLTEAHEEDSVESTASKYSETDETIAHIHELLADEIVDKPARDSDIQVGSYTGVFMNTIEANGEETESVEAPLSMTKVEQETLRELRPEVQAEIYAAADRAEQAVTRLTQASTEDECNEARVTMTEEVLTLLELLGYDNPQEVMADILKTYDIGELRELLQHFLSSNRMAVSQQHDWISRVFSSIAARAILVHRYESLERVA